MRLVLLLAVALVASLFAAYHLFALQLFNLLVPKDAGVTVMARNVPFGADADQTADIYAPTTPGSKRPMLLFVHGGSWESGDKASYAFVGYAFAAQGYVTVVANYRKRPAHAYPAFIADAARAMAFAQQQAEHYGGDAERLYVVAHSAGAYNVMQAVLAPDYLREAQVNAAGLRAIAALAGPYDFLPLDVPASINTFGQVADLASTQPVNFARADAPPLLLLYGKDDTTVRPHNSIELARRIKTLGGSVELKGYDGIGHVGIMLRLAKPWRSSTPPVFEDIASFFAAHA